MEAEAILQGKSLSYLIPSHKPQELSYMSSNSTLTLARTALKRKRAQKNGNQERERERESGTQESFLRIGDGNKICCIVLNTSSKKSILRNYVLRGASQKKIYTIYKNKK
jgi:hypothetical protein